MEDLELFVEDRRENVRHSILPALRRGAIVLLDRYYYSTIAYQGARGIDPAYVRARNEEFAPPADLLIYLRIPVEMAVRRIEVNREEARNLFEKESSLQQVKEIFDSMNDPQLVVVDGTEQPDAVFERIWEIVRNFLQKRTLTPE
jgi:dTMP kinase